MTQSLSQAPDSATEMARNRLIVLFKNWPVSLASNILIGAALAFVVSRETSIEHIAIWYGAMVLSVIPRILLHLSFRKGTKLGEKTLLNLFTLGALLTGLVWASSVLLLGGEFASVENLFVSFVFAGICAGAVSSNAVHFPSFVAFVAPPLLALAAHHLQFFDSINLLMGALVLLFLGFLLRLAYTLCDSMEKQLRLEMQRLWAVDVAAGANAANQSKTDFIARISRDLCIPLKAIVGFSQTLTENKKQAENPQKRAEYLDVIHKSGKYVLNVINDILDVTAMDRGDFELNFQPGQIGAELDWALELMQADVLAKRINIKKAIAKNTPDIRYDPSAIRRAIVNLLSNAIKYTPAGGSIWASVRQREDGAIEISIEDTGNGIPEEVLAAGLTPFTVADGANPEEQGVGLGLPVSRALIEQHGGELEIESNPGRGATVRLLLPSNLIEGQESPPEAIAKSA